MYTPKRRVSSLMTTLSVQAHYVKPAISTNSVLSNRRLRHTYLVCKNNYQKYRCPNNNIAHHKSTNKTMVFKHAHVACDNKYVRIEPEKNADDVHEKSILLKFINLRTMFIN